MKRLDVRFAAGTVTAAEFTSELRALRASARRMRRSHRMTPSQLSLKVLRPSGSQPTLPCATNSSGRCSRSFAPRIAG